MHGGADEQQLRSHAHDIAAAFIANRRPAESVMFPAMWERFLTGMASRPLVPGGDALRDLGLPFDDDSQPFLATPFVIMTVWALLKELNLRRMAPAPAEIDAALRSCARELGTPAPLMDELAETVGVKLAEIFGRPDLPTIASPRADAAAGQVDKYLVDWVEADADDVLNTPSPDRGKLSEAEVEERFRRRIRDFDLFVDEPRVFIYAAGKKANLWHALGGQQRAFLHLVLRGLRRRIITYDEICASVFEMDAGEVESLANARSRVKSELDAILGGILKTHLKAARDQDRYEIDGRVAFCWIRRADAPSLLGRGDS